MRLTISFYTNGIPNVTHVLPPPQPNYIQSFTYDPAGRMRTNSGGYAYTNPTVAKHAPSSVTPTSGTAQMLTYDANGNMLTGLDGKIMAYGGENRPLSVIWLGKKTCYTYGADGTRRKKIEVYTPTQACNAPTPSQPVTAYVASVEIRKYGQGVAEELLLYPHAAIRISKTKPAGVVVTEISTLQRDAQV